METPHESQPIETLSTGEVDVLESIPQTEVQVVLSGVGRLSEIIGVDEARDWFAERDERRAYLYNRAVRKWGHPNRLI